MTPRKEMKVNTESTYVVFVGTRLAACGDLVTVLEKTKRLVDQEAEGKKLEQDAILLFEEQTGEQVDFDMRGSLDEVLSRIPEHPLRNKSEPTPTRGPGRPKLGIVCREVCLLPQHWEWLAEQPGGPSAVLRRLVYEAAQREPNEQQARKGRDATERIMAAIAGNLPGYEEASRALWNGQADRFEQLVRNWPGDIGQYLVRTIQNRGSKI